MRRTIRLVVTVALVIGIFNVAANAATIQCPTGSGGECTGTNNSDTIFERIGNGLDDTIDARDGRDIVTAEEFRRDDDRLFGGSNNDRLRTDDGDGRDFISCGSGNNDVAILDPADHVNHNNCESIRRR